MKFLLLIFLTVITSLQVAHGQSNDWFKGIWYGERTFTNSRISKKALLRMEIDVIHGDLFAGRLIYMYPSDTTARLIRKIGGELYGKYIIISKSQEIYRMDPRSRGFWSDCSHCPGTSSFYIDSGNLVLQITSSACGDTCNGKTTFYRKMQDYEASMQTVVVKKFGGTKAPPAVTSYATPQSTLSKKSASRKDSLKLFPRLLNDSMGIHFDPNRYILPNTSFTDAVSTPKQENNMLNNTSKETPVAPPLTATKDSIAVNKKSSNNAVVTAKTTPIGSAKASSNVSTTNKDKVLQKDTTQVTVKATNKTPARTLVSKLMALPNDTVAVLPTRAKANTPLLPTPAKDTVPEAITERATSLVKTYQVSSPHITVQLFDDGQIDGDAVSVYYNGKVIITSQTLTHKAVTFTIDATAASRHHEFILISESEGFIAPNTALMRIKAGSQQFELNVSSSSARNAKIGIDYTGE